MLIAFSRYCSSTAPLLWQLKSTRKHSTQYQCFLAYSYAGSAMHEPTACLSSMISSMITLTHHNVHTLSVHSIKGALYEVVYCIIVYTTVPGPIASAAAATMIASDLPASRPLANTSISGACCCTLLYTAFHHRAPQAGTAAVTGSRIAVSSASTTYITVTTRATAAAAAAAVVVVAEAMALVAGHTL
jgi:hypothetical protein